MNLSRFSSFVSLRPSLDAMSLLLPLLVGEETIVWFAKSSSVCIVDMWIDTCDLTPSAKPCIERLFLPGLSEESPAPLIASILALGDLIIEALGSIVAYLKGDRSLSSEFFLSAVFMIPI